MTASGDEREPGEDGQHRPPPRMSNDGTGRFTPRIGPCEPEEPWAGSDDPSVAEARAGQTILLAHRAADETLAEAARRATDVLRDAEARARTIVQHAHETASAMVAEAQDSIAEVFGARTDQILALLEESHGRVLDALRATEWALGQPAGCSALAAAEGAGGNGDHEVASPSRLATIRESSRRAAVRAASEGRAAQAQALQRRQAPAVR